MTPARSKRSHSDSLDPVLGVPSAAALLADFYAPIEDDLQSVRQRFDDTLFSDFPFINELCEHVRGYRGKMLRPALLLLTARSLGRVSETHLALSVVVEMIHLATLLHDDVLDEADVRRRRPTIRRLENNEVSVLLGDYLVSNAYHLCSSLGDSHVACRVGATTTTVCEGELMQIHHRGNCELSEPEYFEIIDRKTAALTALCGELGAYAAGAAPEVVQAVAAFGRSAGIAFQIVDDVLDLVGCEEQMGKTLGRDLDLGKPTLPAIHCLHRGDAALSARLRSVLGNGSRASRADVRDWLERSGSIRYAMEQASAYIGQAFGHLDALPSTPARSALAGIAHFMVQRQR